MPELFAGAGAYVISGQIAEILQRFDLGRTLLLPLRIFEHDQKTEVCCDRRYHQIFRYSQLEFLASEASPNLRPNPYDNPPNNWSMPWEPKHDDVAVHDAALDSPAIWVDPRLMGVHFYNGEVVKALKAAGLAHLWRFKECRMI